MTDAQAGRHYLKLRFAIDPHATRNTFSAGRPSGTTITFSFGFREDGDYFRGFFDGRDSDRTHYVECPHDHATPVEACSCAVRGVLPEAGGNEEDVNEVLGMLAQAEAENDLADYFEDVSPADAPE